MVEFREVAMTSEMASRDFVPGVGAKLRAAREKAGLSQQQAAERSGVHAINISKFENDKSTPTLATLYKFAEAYGVDVCKLLPDCDEVKASSDQPSATGERTQTARKRRGKK